MREIWLVIKHDVRTTLQQRSYWVMALLVPVLLIGFNAFVILRESRTASTGSDAEQAGAETPSDLLAVGLVDPAGLISEMPPGFPPSLFSRFSDDTAAQAALEAGEIEQFVSIPADYLTSGDVTVYDKDFQIMRSGEDMGLAFNSTNEWVLAYILNYNLTGDEQLVSTLRNPVPGSQAEWHALNPPQEPSETDGAQARLVAQILPLIYYFLLLMGSNYLLRSVVAEKENRTAEVLLLSIDPRQLMVGKILASSAVLVIQMAIWLGGGWFALERGTQMLNMPAFTFAPGFIVWAVVFLLLGFLLFATIMAAAGTLAQNVREGAPVTWLLVIPLMPTLMLGDLFVRQPKHPLTLFLSLFPFSSPSAMVLRLAVGNAPLWQVLISLALLVVTAYLFVVLAARFFRAGNLLSGTSFHLGQLVTGWRR